MEDLHKLFRIHGNVCEKPLSVLMDQEASVGCSLFLVMVLFHMGTFNHGVAKPCNCTPLIVPRFSFIVEENLVVGNNDVSELCRAAYVTL